MSLNLRLLAAGLPPQPAPRRPRRMGARAFLGWALLGLALGYGGAWGITSIGMGLR